MWDRFLFLYFLNYRDYFFSGLLIEPHLIPIKIPYKIYTYLQNLIVWEKRWFALRVVIVDLGYFSNTLFTLCNPRPLPSPLLEYPLAKIWLTSTFSDFILFSTISTNESSLFMKTTVILGLVALMVASMALSQMK